LNHSLFCSQEDAEKSRKQVFQAEGRLLQQDLAEGDEDIPKWEQRDDNIVKVILEMNEKELEVCRSVVALA